MARKFMVCPHCGKEIVADDYRVLCQCQVCQYSWFTRTPAHPSQCPSCHSSYWDGRPKPNLMTCSKCGRTWQAISEHPKMCPHCHRRDWEETKTPDPILCGGARLSRAVFNEAFYEPFQSDDELISIVKPLLTEREYKVIELRFGFFDNHPWTLEQIGNYFGVTRERIRQIEGKALRKLRHPSHSKLLRSKS